MPQVHALITAIIPVYNVARYLPEFLSSLSAQTLGAGRVEYVFVDDGSTDSSGQVLDDWAEQHPGPVTVVHKENGGVASARNHALAGGLADWVTFPDPDDVLDPRYFEEAAKFITLHGSRDVALLAAHQMKLDQFGVISDTLPSRKRFTKGSRVVNLHVEPMVQLGVNAAFMRRDLLLAQDAQFDPRIRPTFEDAHFVASYLLRSGTHHIGLMASSKYLYRVRADGSSLVQSGYDKPEKYTNVLRYGELDVLRTAMEQLGRVPRWLENTVLYDLVWYFKNERVTRSPSASAPEDVIPEFHALAAEVLALISEDAIRTYDLVGVDFASRLAMMHGYDQEPFRSHYAVLSDVDETSQMVRFSYWFAGELPHERFVVDDVDVRPVHETVQDYDFYGRVLVRQRHVWLPRGRLTYIDIDGQRLKIARGEQNGLPESLSARVLHPYIEAQRARVADPLRVDESRRSMVRRRLGELRRSVTTSKVRDASFEWAVKSSRTKARFRDAWVFMDRDTDANDNAEHLYRWVRDHRPELNAWFVLKKTSRDWTRLQRDGFRLVEFGSHDWRLLMSHAAHLASSHIDEYVVHPLPPRKYGRPRFTYTFLQHGVIHNDLSRWLNAKRVDVFVTTTPAEYTAITGPGPYKFTDREVVMAGLPRHDALLEKRAATAPEDRSRILVQPTWRQGLLGPVVKGSNERQKNDAFMTSDYAQAFTALLNSDRLRDIAARTGKTITFMPHPNMRPYLDDFTVPTHVEVLDFGAVNVQDVLAETVMYITDYTSVAFDAALLEIPMVYFQFDAASFFDGTHVGRRGYFRHDRDGYGPVVSEIAEVEDEVDAVAERAFQMADIYLQRSRASFPARDGRNRERVVAAMIAARRRP